MAHKPIARFLIYAAVLICILAASLALAYLWNWREASSIILLVPLLWAYMAFSRGVMMAVGVLISIVRVLIEIPYNDGLGEWNRVAQVGKQVMFPILLYVGLAVVLTLYRRRQELLLNRLTSATSLEARDRLASSLAHDFGNILSVIYGTAQMLIKDTTLSLQSAKDAHTILSASQQAVSLIRQLSESGLPSTARTSGPEKWALADLNDVLDRQLDLITRLLEPNFKVTRDFAHESLPVRVDVSQILRVLINLCFNARQAMGECGYITVSTAMRFKNGQPRAEFAITDTGPGIKPEVASRLFEPFFTTRADRGGVGLGLSIVQSIVRCHGGEIEVRSAPGQGATFAVQLPLAELPQHAPAKA